MNDLEILKQWVLESKRIVFLGGAGVSTESGIKDFRGVDGLYRQKFEYPPEKIISHSFFLEDPEYFYRFYRDKMMPLGYEPNVTHYVLAKWEAECKLEAIITQNIDGLHQKAGNKRVLELHGSVFRNYCMSCKTQYDADFIMNTKGIPRCKCGDIVRPDVVLYEEPLDDFILQESISSVQNADMMIVAGTSLTVYPAAGLINHYCGDRLVLINADATPADHIANLVFHDRLGKIFSQLT